jgi:alkyldihydroxyacetonephosphate synthase
MRQLIMGSEGAFGIITAVRLRIHPRPEVRVYEGWKFANFAEGEKALRTLMQDGPLPTVLRLSDEVETALNLADPSSAGGGATAAGGVLVVVGFEGTPDDVASRQKRATKVLLGLGGEPLGEEPGEKWRTGRFRGPYLRDPLLDAGALVETLETVTYWSNVDRLKADVTAALTEALVGQGTQPLVMCHISHVYDAGASLYFTVVCAAKEDPVAQWALAKTAANNAIRAAGASITHHHAVGIDHRETYAEEIGPLAIEILRAVKKTVDPAGILNPGILFA